MAIEISQMENYSSILQNYRSKIVSPDEAVKCIKSYNKIIIHSNCAFPAPAPNPLIAPSIIWAPDSTAVSELAMANPRLLCA